MADTSIRDPNDDQAGDKTARVNELRNRQTIGHRYDGTFGHDVDELVREAVITELNNLYVQHNVHFEKDSCDIIKGRIAELQPPHKAGE